MLKTATIQFTPTAISFVCGTNTGYSEPASKDGMEKALATLHRRLMDNGLMHVHSHVQFVDGVKHTIMLFLERV